MKYLELDEIDKKVLKENFDDEILKSLDGENVSKIYSHLISKGIYFAKDIFISQVDLFLIDYDLFVQKFENIINQLGSNYVEQLEEDSELLDKMYE